MKFIFIAINIILAFMGTTGQVYSYLVQNTDYMSVSNVRNQLFEQIVNIVLGISALPVCIIGTGIALASIVYGVFKYFDTLLSKDIYPKAGKCFVWFLFTLLCCCNVWGMINIMLLQAG